MVRLGEFERIRCYFKPLAAHFEGALELSDDAALLPVPSGETLVVTTDAMVEGVHYLAGEDPGRVARKALRVNLSDLAAMGARPLAYLLTTALPGSVDEGWLVAFAAGLRDDQERYGIHLAGGDSVSTPGPATISVTAFGAVPEGREIRRSGARPGDRVWVSGTIGDGALGLLAAREELKTLSPAHREYLAGRYHLPSPRLALGERLWGMATAAGSVVVDAEATDVDDPLGPLRRGTARAHGALTRRRPPVPGPVRERSRRAARARRRTGGAPVSAGRRRVAPSSAVR